MKQGLVAMVTGGTRGIGRSVVRALTEAGVKTAFCSRRENDVREAEAELRQSFPESPAFGMACDVADPGAVARFVEAAERALGPVDVLVNCAGIGYFGPFCELERDQWTSILDTNVMGTVHCCRELIPRMLARAEDGGNGGYIITIGSTSAERYVAGNAAYAASKAAIAALSDHLFYEYRQKGILVTHLIAGRVNTTFSPRNVLNAEWKISPEELGRLVSVLITYTYAVQGAVIRELDVRTRTPKAQPGEKE